MTLSRTRLIASIALQALTVPVAVADDGRAQEHAVCMERTGNQMFCDCRIIVNPRYSTSNMFIKVMAAQKCGQMFGHALYEPL